MQANPLKAVAFTQQERQQLKVNLNRTIRTLLIGYLGFASIIICASRLFTTVRYGRYFVGNTHLIEDYMRIAGTEQDTSLDAATYYTVFLIFLLLVIFGMILNFFITGLPILRDLLSKHKIIELAVVEKVTSTAVGYIIHTNSTRHYSINLAEDDNNLPQIGQQIILAYYKYTNVFIGYYFE